MPRSRPNILIYFLDELRADALGCYGHPFVQTPTLDRIAAAGVRFDRCHSNCPLCMPARNSFFTGLYPTEHGVTWNAVPDDLRAEMDARPPLYAFGRLLRDAGVERIVDIGKHHTGFPASVAGFTEAAPAPDRLGAAPSRTPEGYVATPGDLIRIPGHAPNSILAGTYPTDGEETHAAHCVDRALAFLNDPGHAPWLLRVSIDTPHTPVLPPEPYASMYRDEVRDWSPDPAETERRAPVLRDWIAFRGFDRLSVEEQRRCRAAYLGLTTFLDAQLGRLEAALEARGLTDDLLTIVVADHGSSIGDHGCQVKGPVDTDDISRVPLLIRWPGRIRPGVYPDLTQLLDIVPTLADLLGVEKPRPCSGRSLRPALEGDPAPIHDAVVACGGRPPLDGVPVGLRETLHTMTHLYTRYPERGEEELFDRVADPGQTRNIAADAPDIRNACAARLDAWRAEHGAHIDLTTVG